MNFSLSMFRLLNGIEGSLLPERAAERARRLFMSPRRQPLKEWEQRMEEQGERLLLDGNLSLIRWGHGPHRALLMHGWESRATQLGAIAQLLVDQGYSVYGLDAPGHGTSAGKHAHIGVFFESLMRVGNHLGPFDLVVGHSVGATAVGMALAKGMQARAAVLIAGPADVTSVLQRFSRFIGLPANAGAAFLRRVEQHVGIPAAEINLRLLGRQVACPVLFLHDRDDSEIPVQDSVEAARAWVTAQLHLTQGLGHRRVLRAPEVLSVIDEFVAARQQKRSPTMTASDAA